MMYNDGSEERSRERGGKGKNRDRHPPEGLVLKRDRQIRLRLTENKRGLSFSVRSSTAFHSTSERAHVSTSPTRCRKPRRGMG
jgi:hypothetical protein